MSFWLENIQRIIDEIDICIKNGNDESYSLDRLAKALGYSRYTVSRKFHEISGMSFRDYLRFRNLAFAFKEVRDTDRPLIDIAIGRGFSSQEAFSRAFRQVYGITPGEYRLHPVPVKLQTIIRPFDCYLLAENAFKDKESKGDVKIYFAEIPEHKFLHIKNYESIGYWDFWQKQSLIPGQDCETVTGILDSIPHKLDDSGESEANSGAGQVMAFINEPEGRICSWGIPLAECYGVRLPADYSGPVPEGMLMKHVPKGEYIVFEHGPFDYETESASVEEKIERAMREFDYEGNGCRLSPEYGRIFYFFHDTKRFFKYIRPIERI